MPDSYETESLVDLLRRYAAGELTPEGYLGTLAERHQAIEPKVQAWMEEPDRFERLSKAAEELAAKFPEAASRPALYGVPVGVKDIFRVDGLPTTAGSNLPVSLFEGEQAAAVSRLQDAGALVLGKTVSTEFAYFAPGPTRNPLDSRRTPGGSSSGSAAAVAAGLTPLALGTQTIGSISRPASYCGVVGYKPSYDRISRDGVVPLSPSLDHVGVFAANVAGAELAASVLCGYWSDADGLAAPNVAIPKGPILKRAAGQTLQHLKRTYDRLAATGFGTQVVPAMLDFDVIEMRHRRLVAAEAAAVHTNWYADHGALYHPKTVTLLTLGRDVSESELEAARNGRAQLRDELTALMDEHGIDLWISPAAQSVAPEGLDNTGDPIMNLPWSHCGLPTLTVPAGTGEGGMPLGLQIAARWNEDEKLLAWGKLIETALKDGDS